MNSLAEFSTSSAVLLAQVDMGAGAIATVPAGRAIRLNQAGGNTAARIGIAMAADQAIGVGLTGPTKVMVFTASAAGAVLGALTAQNTFAIPITVEPLAAGVFSGQAFHAASGAHVATAQDSVGSAVLTRCTASDGAGPGACATGFRSELSSRSLTDWRSPPSSICLAAG